MAGEAVILAGGLGTRLREVVSDLPKPMAPVNGRPFLEYLLSYLQKYHIRKVILATGYKHETISAHFGNNYKSLDIIYSVEKEPLGTGGALLLATDKITDDNFLMLNGDTYFEVNLPDFENFHVSSDAVMSVALRPVKNAGRYGTVTLNNGRIVSFSEKAGESQGLINGGIYMINRDWFRSVAPGSSFSLEKDILEKKITGNFIAGFVSDSYFIDIGVPEDYLRAAEELLPPD